MSQMTLKFTWHWWYHLALSGPENLLCSHHPLIISDEFLDILFIRFFFFFFFLLWYNMTWSYCSFLSFSHHHLKDRFCTVLANCYRGSKMTLKLCRGTVLVLCSQQYFIQNHNFIFFQNIPRILQFNTCTTSCCFSDETGWDNM